MRSRTLAVVPAAVLAVALMPGAASAAPESETLQMQCGEQTLTVVVKGRGAFTPGHVVGTNQLLIPVYFGPQSYVVRVDGEIVEEGVDPATLAKGQSAAKNPRATVECTFSATFVEEDAVITVDGSVTGILTPGGRR